MDLRYEFRCFIFKYFIYPQIEVYRFIKKLIRRELLYTELGELSGYLCLNCGCHLKRIPNKEESKLGIEKQKEYVY